MKLLTYFSKEFLSGLKWNLIGQIVIRTSNFFLGILLANFLLPADYGKYTYVVGLVTFLVSSFSLSIRVANTKYIADRGNANTAILSTLILSLLSFCTLLFLFEISVFPDIPLLVNNKFLLLFCISFEILVVGIYGILEGNVEYKKVNIFAISLNILRFFAVYFGIKIFSLEVGLGAFLTLGICNGIILYFYYHRISHINIQISKQKIVRSFNLISGSIPILLSTTLPALVYWFIQTWAVQDSSEELAKYSVAYQLRGLGLYLPYVITGMYQAFVKRMVGLERKMNRTSIAVSILACFILFLFSFFAVDIYGLEYADSGFFVRLFLISIMLASMNEITRQRWILNDQRLKLIVLPLLSAVGAYIVFYFFSELDISLGLNLVLYILVFDLIFWLLGRITA